MALDTDLISRGLARTARQHRVPGAQLAIHHDGKTLTCEFSEHSGLDRDTAVPIGSITKAFTATLAMALVSDGDLDLDVPIVDIAPELRRLSAGLTLRHLLSHTGGLTSDSSPEASTSLRRHIEECCELTPVLPPGGGFSYSNVGYMVIARLIELVTGMTWHEAVDTILLRPLGITPAFVCAPRQRRPIAVGHAINRATGAIRPVEQSLAPAEAATGALAASALDLVAFGQMHLAGTDHIVEAADLAVMHKPQPDAEPFGLAEGWGLGLAVFAGGWLGHDGMADGTSCHLRIQPESGSVVALTTNTSSGFEMWKRFLPELRGAGLEVGDYESISGQLQPIAPPDDCTGRYRNGDTEYSIVRADSGRLKLAIDGEVTAQLTVHDGLMFSIGDLRTGEYIHAGRFLRDLGHHVSGIQITGRVAARGLA